MNSRRRQFIAFDCLYRRGRDLRPRPLRDRRAALEDEIAGAELVFPSLRLTDDGLGAWAEVTRRGWEGLLAKDEQSRYVGRRSRSWVKLKVRHEGRFAVVGLDTGDGGPSSLLLAARQARRLVYVGRVEWGVAHGAVEGIAARCTTRPAPACEDAERARDVVWVEPRVIVEVTYSELMLGRLRDPVLRAILR